MRILIIEDDTTIAANLYDFLESRGHAVDAAAGPLVNFGDIPNISIPRLAEGGIVDKPGGILAMIGEAGPEAVIPLDRAGGMGGNNITINVQGADPNAVVQALQRYVRQSGPVPVNIRAM